MMDDDMPNIIMTVVIVMIVLAVGTFAFFTTTSEIGYEKNRQETFSVDNPKVAQTCNLNYFVESLTRVEQYNGISWVTVDPSYYSLSNKQVTVQPGGMQG